MKTFICKSCNKEKKLKSNNVNQRYCNRECYTVFLMANPGYGNFGRKRGIDPELDEGKKPTFTHSFDKIVSYIEPTGNFPMFI